MEFRQQALSKLQSPEEIDLPVRFARPQGLLVLIVTVLAMAGASVWAVAGSVSSTLGAPGILTHAQGSYILQSPVAGQVTEILAEEGARLPADAPLVKVRTARGEDTVIRTLAAGRLTTIVPTIGSVVTTGTDVAAVERAAKKDDPLMVMLYVPADSGSSVPLGAPVDLTVQSVPKQQYGVLRGRVKAVGRTAETRRHITSFLGSSELGEHFTRSGQPVPILVRLEPSTTRTGYAWSTSDGPPYGIASMTLVDGSVHLADQHPIEWLLP
ncbi:HlyD family efflux transporter periplasmic adaptor subunit [Streptomyces sp. SP18CS02]|uniref:HlyD family efflux transporter periplasmic adaptor subunit n=1 Tax=Streptomyces sp. SP18CS02 TaxID=3002531 RepID=UPI002E76A6F9|nr:HlyD family efflux transporter periplasmic adaptor subunit [Streptomyces sp. SP18CS02]MEE1753996.1 HlyD family efflux transporter periplasmic adaptor subunit [Streptomyces sp. SP18CS02]